MCVLPWCTCGGQRVTFGTRLSPSILQVPGIVIRTPDLAASMFYPLSHLGGLNIFKAWAGTCLNSRAVAFRDKAKASWRGQNQHRDFRFLSEDLETGNLQFMLNIALI